MEGLYPIGSNPEKKNVYFCINPNCPEPQRSSISEHPCQVCGSDLLLNGRYRVTGQLSPKRNISAVFEAIDLTQKNVSKVLKVLYSNNEEAISRFNREADFLINNWIPGLPKADAEGYFPIEFPNDPTPAYCLVMEKIEGLNLQQWLDSRNGQPMGEREAIDGLKQLTKILGKLHYQNFFHRDLKPSNIMRREKNGQLVLIDLDAARAVVQAAVLGRDYTRIGTPGYSAPEQMNRGQVTAQSDFYALGRTFVHLLTGHFPSELEESPGKLAWRSHAAQISNKFADLIDHLIDWSPDRRPQSATEILKKLEDVERSLKFKEQVQAALNFKKIFAGIVFLGVAGLFLLAIFPRTNQGENATEPNLTVSQTNGDTEEIDEDNESSSDSECRIRNNDEKDQNALALDAEEAIQRAYNDPALPELRPFNPAGKIFARQSECTVTVTVLYSEREFNQEIQDLLREKIKNNVHSDAQEKVKVKYKF